MADSFSPRTDVPIFNPKPVQAIADELSIGPQSDFDPSTLSPGVPEMPANVTGGLFGPEQSFEEGAGAMVPDPYTPLHDARFESNVEAILAKQGYDSQGRPLSARGMSTPGSRQDFMESYFEEHGNPIKIDVASETDRIMDENIEKLWNSFFGGSVSFNGNLSNAQAKEWNQFLTSVYTDTHQRVEADKQRQIGEFKFSLGEFSIIEEREFEENRRSDVAASKERAATARAENELVELEKKERLKHKLEQEFGSTTKKGIIDSIYVKLRKGLDLTDSELRMVPGLKEDKFRAAGVVSSLLRNSQTLQGYLDNSMNDSDIEGFDKMTFAEQEMYRMHQYTKAFKGVVDEVDTLLNAGTNLDEAKFMKDAQAYSSKISDMNDAVDSGFRETNPNASPHERVVELVTFLVRTKGYSKADARMYVDHMIEQQRQIDEREAAQAAQVKDNNDNEI